MRTLISPATGSGLGLFGRISAFRAATSAVAAIEFALILPVMVVMMLGMSEVTLAVNASRKLTLLSRTLADLSSRKSPLSSTELANIFSASSIVMQPFKTQGLKMKVTSVRVRTTNGTSFQGTVHWSCGRGAGISVPAQAAGQDVTVPDGLKNATTTKDRYYINVEATLDYTPLFGKTISGTIHMVEKTPWPVRNVDMVVLTGNTCPPNPTS